MDRLLQNNRFIANCPLLSQNLPTIYIHFTVRNFTMLIVKSPTHFNHVEKLLLRKPHLLNQKKDFKEFILQYKIVRLVVDFNIPILSRQKESKWISA